MFPHSSRKVIDTEFRLLSTRTGDKYPVTQTAKTSEEGQQSDENIHKQLHTENRHGPVLVHVGAMPGFKSSRSTSSLLENMTVTSTSLENWKVMENRMTHAKCHTEPLHSHHSLCWTLLFLT